MFGCRPHQDSSTEPSDARDSKRCYPDRLAYRFYYGYALLRDKKYDLAIANLQPVATADSTTFQAAAQYHLGLAYAGAGQYAQARTTLNQFLHAPNTLQKYHAGAEAVLQALRRE